MYTLVRVMQPGYILSRFLDLEGSQISDSSQFDWCMYWSLEWMAQWEHWPHHNKREELLLYEQRRPSALLVQLIAYDCARNISRPQ